MTARATMTAKVIAGTRPVGSCPPNGQTRWATRVFDDDLYTFTTFDGWLIDSETTTTDPELAKTIQATITARIETSAPARADG